MKLMKLYYLALQELKDLPDSYGYKILSQELTRYRMKVVDETVDIRAIEDKIAAGLVEELTFQAHNEIKLLRIMKSWKPWEYLMTKDFEGKEIMQEFLNFKSGDPFAATYESYDHEKQTPEERAPLAFLHPEDK